MNCDLGGPAVSCAGAGLEVFPLVSRSKVPLRTCPIGAAHRAARRPDRCPGGCGHEGHGVLDATTDLEEIVDGWWSAHPTANIGGAAR